MTFRAYTGRMAAVLSLCSVLVLSVSANADAEDELKSAALLAFVQNAHWMEKPAANTALTVGVLGRPAFLRWLRTSLDGKTVDGHAVRTLEVKTPADLRGCQVVYFATDKVAEIKPWMQALGSEHVLTVGEAEHFLEEGGAVNLFLVDGHMAFEVSLGALERSGIAISSKLLRFGQIRDLNNARRAK